MKIKKAEFFVAWVHTNNEKDNNRLIGVDWIKKSVLKKSMPTKPIQWKIMAIAVAIWYVGMFFNTGYFIAGDECFVQFEKLEKNK